MNLSQHRATYAVAYEAHFLEHAADAPCGCTNCFCVNLTVYDERGKDDGGMTINMEMIKTCTGCGATWEAIDDWGKELLPPSTYQARP